MRILLLSCILVCYTLKAVAQSNDTTVPASLRYSHPGLIQKIFIGGNYRTTWSQPVTLKIFRLKEEKGGFVITGIGGGMQTKSLRLKDKNGEQWSLRTVDKSVDKALAAEGINNPLIKSITQDMISAAHPYGTLIVPPLARALGVLSTEPEVFFVPDDPAFGKYREVFANKVCLLEKRAPVFHPGEKAKDTKQLSEDLASGARLRLDKQMLLQARLIDMLIGDWDRHGDQWKWDYATKGDSTIIYPIPRDHDQALFHSSGLLIKLVRPFTMQHIIGFRKKSVRLKKLNKKEWYFDHSLLRGLSEADWRRGIAAFQKALTDDVLRSAVSRLPAQVYAAQGEWVFRRLQTRRDSMTNGAMRYYHFLQTAQAAKAVDGRAKKMARMKE